MRSPLLSFRSLVLSAMFVGGMALPMSSTRLAHATVVERVVAVVGRQAILFTEVHERARPFLAQIYGQLPQGPQRTASISQAYTMVLKQMVEEELQDQAAGKAGIVVSSQEIEEAIDRVAAQNSLDRSKLIEEIKRNGMSLNSYRDEMRRQVLQAKIQSARFAGRVRVSESDLKESYRNLAREERLRLPMRLVRIVMNEGNDPQARSIQLKKAQRLIAEAKSGTDFRDLISRYSELPGSGLGAPVTPAQEPPMLQRASLRLEIGDISRPLRYRGQLIVEQLIERQPSQLPAFETVRDQLEQRVYMEKLEKARKHWLRSVRRRTHVEVRL